MLRRRRQPRNAKMNNARKQNIKIIYYQFVDFTFATSNASIFCNASLIFGVNVALSCSQTFRCWLTASFECSPNASRIESIYSNDNANFVNFRWFSIAKQTNTVISIKYTLTKRKYTDQLSDKFIVVVRCISEKWRQAFRNTDRRHEDRRRFVVRCQTREPKW